MEIVNFSSNIEALSTSYVGDSDLLFRSKLNSIEDNIAIYDENYLKNSINKINNYSSLYLTDKKELNDLVYLKGLDNGINNETFSTSIKNQINESLSIDLNDNINSNIPKFINLENLQFYDLTNTIFEINIIDDISLYVSHKLKNREIYYISYNTSGEFIYSKIKDESIIFNYILDRKNNSLSLFKNDNDVLKCLIVENGLFKLTTDVNVFKSSPFKINYYIQNLELNLNTSWVSYENRHKNAYFINPFKSIRNLDNNFLVTTQYSHITGNNLGCNMMILKNQKTNKNYSYRSDYLNKNHKNVPVVDNRRYFGLFTGNDQERGDYSITLGYEFYNSDYKFQADKYTVFKTPESLYPYTKININDLEWNNRGSIAGENPHTSDKIFKKTNPDKLNGVEYLCSWLKKEKDGDSVWLDRYFYPDKTSYAKALESPSTYDSLKVLNDGLTAIKLNENEYYDIPYVYNSINEELNHTPQTLNDVIYGSVFFDKKSDLTIEPNTEYIYHRIGNNYVSEILDSIKEELLINGLELKTSKDVSIIISGDVDDVEYELNNDSYTRIEKYDEINKTHQFTISFWMKSDDWTKGFGHQILGNLNDKGFALLDDEKITPMIMVQSDKNVYVYNTNFELLDTASLSNEEASRINSSKIKDIYRTEHLNTYYTVNID